MKRIITICILFLTTSCAWLPSPELTWNHDPATRIIEVSSANGLEPRAAYLNGFPAAQVWGDGRIVWQTWDEDYQRQVWQGQLSEAELATLLKTFADKGFFGMNNRYAPKEDILDGSTTRISVHLLSASTTVSEYVSGAPPQFYELIDLLTSGAGVKATPYIPQSGHLTAKEIKPQNELDKTALPIWDATALGLDLHDAAGIWLEGDALMYAWEVVNQDHSYPIIMQGDSYFELYLQLPELTGQTPR